MKRKYNILILFSCLLFYSSTIFSQATKCGSFYFESLMGSTDPDYSVRKAALQTSIQDTLMAHHTDSLIARSMNVSYAVTKIPVVFHIIGNTALTLVNSSVIQQAISDLNDIFRNTGTNANNTTVDTYIEFCLSLKDESGNGTTGINIIPNPANGTYGPYSMTDQEDQDIKTLSHWNGSKYLNIWICDLSTATEKVWGSNPSLYLNVAAKKYRDGVVCDMTAFSAKLLAHGIGHWLNLKHTYGDDGSTCGNANNDAGCADTPWCFGSAALLACSTLTDQCPSNNTSPNNYRLIQNYMDDSDEGCKNMFTAGQTTNMQVILAASTGRPDLSQNSIAACTPTTLPCSETNCGGACQPCTNCYPEMNFKINGHTTNWWDIVNVCNGYNDIILTPFSATCTTNNFQWAYSEVQREFHGSTPNTISQAINGDYPRWVVWDDQSNITTCTYEMLYLSITECDANRNLISPEHGTWFNISGSNLHALNLNSFLYYLGPNLLVAGKYFMIKLASGNASNWQSHPGFIKVFEPNVSLGSETITNSQVGNNISISNCSVTGPINVVASNAIEILPNSSLTSGNYFISTFDCSSNVSSFRTSNTTNSTNYANDYESVNFSTSQKSSAVTNTKLLGKSDQVVVKPNPNNGNFTILSDENEGSLKSIEIQNTLGMVIQTISQPGSSTEVNIQNQPSGLYLVKLNYVDKVLTKKIIKQ